MKLFIMALSITTCFLLQSCTTVGCLAVNESASIATNFVSNALECSNTDQLDADITALLSKSTGICMSHKNKSVMRGPIANMICPEMSSVVVGFVLAQGSNFLTKYGCTAANVSAFSQNELTAFCEQLPLTPKPKH